jgi:hypothetical protein
MKTHQFVTSIDLVRLCTFIMNVTKCKKKKKPLIVLVCEPGADPSDRAVYGMCPRPLACWDCGFESRRDIVVCLLCVLRVVRWRFLRRTDHSYRRVLPSVVCLRVIVKPRQ